MVWFQCEACGENLKKPKLPNHFRMCSAYKLSCIDCGVTFDKQSVQSHTQCITEAEKYGPKGQGKVANGTPKPTKDKPKADVDINVGLSDRPPWFCSLCNTKATSKQALLLHADGKKHRAKVRAYIASQQPKPSEEAAPTDLNSSDCNLNNSLPNDKCAGEKKENSDGVSVCANSLPENTDVTASTKKRKLDASKDDTSSEKSANGSAKEDGSKAVAKETAKKAKHKTEQQNGNEKKDTDSMKEESKLQNIKWKKLISSALKATSDGSLKMKKLCKVVSKSLKDSSITIDDKELKNTVEHKVNSCSKFAVEGKYVRMSV